MWIVKHTKEQLLSNFMELVFPEPNTGCWLWAGPLTKTGYGEKHLTIDDKRINKAHRISYYLNRGAFDLSLNVLHKCDNRGCVNPEHLYIGTHLDNMNDMIKRGRAKPMPGSLNPASKLSDEDVLTIRQMLSNGVRQDLIAEKYDVCRSTIWEIKYNRSYKK